MPRSLCESPPCPQANRPGVVACFPQRPHLRLKDGTSWLHASSPLRPASRPRLAGLLHSPCRKTKSSRWRLALALDSGGSPNTNDQDNIEEEKADIGRTRLGTIVRSAAAQLLEKLNSARRNFPMKIFLLLLGFYTANALATILGQTGDWDVLVAGVVVAAIEGIGMLMYRKGFTSSFGSLKSLIGMLNYWKAGVCLGLFVDAFKLGS